MTREDLINNEWVETTMDEKYGGFKQYHKKIRGYHYCLTDCKSGSSIMINPQLYDWQLYIETPQYQTICTCEVNSLEHIDLLKEIYHD